MKQLIVRFIREDEGQDLIEYALLAGLISIAVVAAINLIGARIIVLFDNIKAAIGA